MIIVWLISYIYAVLHMVVGVSQLKQKNVPIKNSILFILGSTILLTTLAFKEYVVLTVVLIILGFITIQIGAIMNGLHLKGKITLSHQLFRIGLLLLLIFMYLIFN